MWCAGLGIGVTLAGDNGTAVAVAKDWQRAQCCARFFRQGFTKMYRMTGTSVEMRMVATTTQVVGSCTFRQGVPSPFPDIPSTEATYAYSADYLTRLKDVVNAVTFHSPERLVGVI